MRLIFLAFLLICQLSLAYSASAVEIDPNELVLQRLKSGNATAGVTKIPVKKEVTREVTRVEEPAKKEVPKAVPAVAKAPAPVLSVGQRNPSKPVVDARQNAVSDYIYKPAATPAAAVSASTFRAKPVLDEPKAQVVAPVPVKAVQAPKPVVEAAKQAPKPIVEPMKQAVVPVAQLDKIETAAGETKAVTWFSTLSNGQRMTITFERRPNLSFEETADSVIFKFDGVADYSAPLVPETFRGSFMLVEKLPTPNLSIRVKHKANAKHLITYNERRVFLDIIDEKKEEKIEKDAAKTEAEEKAKAAIAKPVDKPAIPAEEKPAETKEEKAAEKKEDAKDTKPAAVAAENNPVTVAAAEVEKVEATPASPKYISYDKNIVIEKDDKLESFSFTFAKKTDAALFERFGNYWLVFATDEAFGLPNISKSGIFANVERMPNADAIVYKFTLKDTAYASVSRERNTWKITFDPLIEHPVEFPLTMRKDGEEIYVNVPGVEKSVEITDDFTNEVLTVLPSQNAGEGFKDRVVYRDFVVEQSLLGIVLRKVTEGSKISFDRNQLRLSPSVLPQTLYADGKEGKGTGKEKLIDFTEIKTLQKKFLAYDATDAIRKIDPELRGKGLFALKYYREAASDFSERPGFDNGFLAASSYFMAGRFDKAVTDLQRINVPEEKDLDEFLMWLIAAKQELIKQDPRAKVEPKIPEGFGLPQNLKNYPVDIATALQIPIVETALADKNIDFAALVVSNIPKEVNARDADYTRYLQAEVFSQQNRKQRAIAIWNDLIAKSNSREVRARATYAKVMTQLDIKAIDNQQALKELDAARILWRGSALEFDILTKVAELYALNKQYPEALWAYKTAITEIPLHPRSDEITEAMRNIYKTAMQRNFSDLQKSFEALTLYYDFIELKPTGREGEYLTIELAERLVGFDLLEQAAKVLEDFIVNVNDPEEKALINTRIAILHYINHEPEKALERLNMSEDPATPKYVDWQRKALYAKILSEQGKYAEALEKTARVPKQVEYQMKTDIYWHKQDWPNYIANFEGLTKRTHDAIIKAAVAYSMMNDDKALDGFRKQNEAAMQTGKYAKAFEFITQKTALNYNDLPDSVKLDLAKEVVAEYKENMKLTDFYEKPAVAAGTKPKEKADNKAAEEVAEK